MSSMPSKLLLQDAFSKLSLEDVNALWDAMMQAARKLTDYSLTDEEILAEGQDVLTLAAVMLNDGSRVRDAGVYVDFPLRPYAIYVDSGIDMPTLMFLPETRAFEIKRHKVWLTRMADYMDIITDLQEVA